MMKGVGQPGQRLINCHWKSMASWEGTKNVLFSYG